MRTQKLLGPIAAILAVVAFATATTPSSKTVNTTSYVEAHSDIVWHVEKQDQ